MDAAPAFAVEHGTTIGTRIPLVFVDGLLTIAAGLCIGVRGPPGTVTVAVVEGLLAEGPQLRSVRVAGRVVCRLPVCNRAIPDPELLGKVALGPSASRSKGFDLLGGRRLAGVAAVRTGLMDREAALGAGVPTPFDVARDRLVALVLAGARRGRRAGGGRRRGCVVGVSRVVNSILETQPSDVERNSVEVKGPLTPAPDEGVDGGRNLFPSVVALLALAVPSEVGLGGKVICDEPRGGGPGDDVDDLDGMGIKASLGGYPQPLVTGDDLEAGVAGVLEVAVRGRRPDGRERPGPAVVANAVDVAATLGSVELAGVVRRRLYPVQREPLDAFGRIGRLEDVDVADEHPTDAIAVGVDGAAKDDVAVVVVEPLDEALECAAVVRDGADAPTAELLEGFGEGVAHGIPPMTTVSSLLIIVLLLPRLTIALRALFELLGERFELLGFLCLPP